MKYLINPMTSVRYRGKPASRKKFHAAGFSRNAPRRKKRASPAQIAARKKFAAASRARAAASRKGRAHSTSSKGASMARRKRKAVARRSTRRRRRVTTARRRVYAANPGRKHRRRRPITARRSRRRSYRRNPGFGSGILGQVLDVTMKGGAVAGGRIAFNAVNQNFGASLVSAGDSVTTAAAKKLLLGAVVGVGIKMATRKMGGRAKELGDYAAAGAVSAPMMALLAALAPATMTGYLGDGVMAMPRFNLQPGRRQIGNYPGGVASYAEHALGSYSESAPY